MSLGCEREGNVAGSMFYCLSRRADISHIMKFVDLMPAVDAFKSGGMLSPTVFIAWQIAITFGSFITISQSEG